MKVLQLTRQELVDEASREDRRAHVWRESSRQSMAIWEQSIDKEEGADKSVHGNDGTIAQAWVNVGGGLSSEGWTPRKRGIDGSSGEAGRNYQAFIACGLRCQRESRKTILRNSLWFNARAHVH